MLSGYFRYSSYKNRNAMFKKVCIFLLTLVGVSSVISAQNNNLETTPVLKEWSVLMYGVPVDAARFAIKNIDDAMSGISDTATNAVLCCDLWTKYAALWQISSQTITQLTPILEPETHSARITRLMNFLMTQYPAKKYALVVQGGGSAFVDHVWDAQSNSWSGHSGMRRGILYNDIDGTYFSLSDLVSTLTTISNGLGRKLDLFVADAGYMTGLELVMALSDSVQVYVAPESKQFLAGFKYKPLFEALAVPGATATDVGTAIVQSSSDYYNGRSAETAIPATHCYAAIDCGKVSNIWRYFGDFMTQLNALLALRPALAMSVYQLRDDLGLLGLKCCYVDSIQWLEVTQVLLAAQSDDADVLALSAEITPLKAQFQSACLSLAAGAGAGVMNGMMLSYSQANPGAFMVNQAGPWNQFVNASCRGGVYA